MTVASVVPDVLRTCIWIWSYVSVSGQCGWYQYVSTGEPDGTVTVCVSVLFPFTADVEPSRAAYEPVCAVVEMTGANAPDVFHPVSEPASNPPFTTGFGGGGAVAVIATSSKSAYVGSVG
jgi:hypothetical protein